MLFNSGKIKFLLKLLFASLIFFPSLCYGESADKEMERLREKTKLGAREKIMPILERYCGRYCELVDIQVDIEEEPPEPEDLGFESLSGVQVRKNLIVRKINAEIQVDDRIGSVNLERLTKILEIHLRSFGVTPYVTWHSIKMPRIKTSADEPPPGRLGGDIDGSRTLNLSINSTSKRSLERLRDLDEADSRKIAADQNQTENGLKGSLQKKIMAELNQVIENYCPSQCIIERLEIFGNLAGQVIPADVPQTQILRDMNGDNAFLIDRIEIDVTMDSELEQSARDQISAIMKARTRFVTPVNFNIGVIRFPETYIEKQERLKMNSRDPYGLEKLRQMLVMFRDLAGTKEIITNSTSNSVEERKNSSDSKTVESSRNSSNLSSNSISKSETTNSAVEKHATVSSQNRSEGLGLTTEELVAYLAGFILLVTLMAIIIIKFNNASRDAREMIISSHGKEASSLHGEDMQQTDFDE
ncbi:MAG: hypothetical protein HQK54_16600 [Oligoflexales bacterium]|nr:hypothetical protein [Oligoflexales bacterium]